MGLLHSTVELPPHWTINHKNRLDKQCQKRRPRGGSNSPHPIDNRTASPDAYGGKWPETGQTILRPRRDSNPCHPIESRAALPLAIRGQYLDKHLGLSNAQNPGAARGNRTPIPRLASSDSTIEPSPQVGRTGIEPAFVGSRPTLFPDEKRPHKRPVGESNPITRVERPDS